MTKKTKIERLDMLATMLEELPEWRKEFVVPKGASFSLSHEGPPTRFNMDMFCGTAACAVGSAAYHPWFQARGLTVKGKSVRYGAEYDFQAAAAFFGLSFYTSRTLFMPIRSQQLLTLDSDDLGAEWPYPDLLLGPNITPKQVAANIREYVRAIL